MTGIVFLLILIISGCSITPNYAPVRTLTRDLNYGQKYYTVKPGDTLYSIGYRSGHGYRRLALWNKIVSPYTLLVGQKIKLFKPRWVPKVKKQPNKPAKTLEKVRYSSQKNKNNQKKRRNSSQISSSISSNKKKMLKLFWQWPIKGKILNNFSQTGKKGIDIYARIGTKVRAAEAGKVVYSGSGLKGYGNLLIIKHNYLYLSAYANNRRLLVKEGQWVRKGQNIAEVGLVGGKRASLHFEIRKNGLPVNPFNYLPKN